MVYLSNQILFVILVAVLFVGGSSKLMFWGIEEGWRGGLGDDDDADAAERDKKCLAGCTRATLPSGNCKWLPKNVPRSQQRYICPHTCQKESAEAGSDKLICRDDTECSKCTPQTDYTARTYSGTQVIKGTGNACAIGKPCIYKPNPKGGARVLNICNPHDAPNNGANNLVCVDKSGANDPSKATWEAIDTAIGVLPPYTPDQVALVTCDLNEACSTEGERCTDSTGNRVICQNNLWLNDPKYSSKSTARHGHYGDRGDGDRHGDGHGYRTGGSGYYHSGGRSGGSGDIIDNYYTVNHFYGAAPATTAAAKPAATTAAAPATTAAAPILSTPAPSNNYGVSAGSTTVPLMGPKGTVAIVQAYESSIRL